MKNEILKEKFFKLYEFLPYLIIYLMPIGLLTGSGKMYKNVLLPLLIILAVVKIYKYGLKYSFYEKYMIAFIITVMISIIFSNYEKADGLNRLKDNLYWLLLPLVLGQFELNKFKFKYLILGFIVAFILIFSDYIEMLKNQINTVMKTKFVIRDFFKIETIKTIVMNYSKNDGLRFILGLKISETAFKLWIFFSSFIFFIYSEKKKRILKIILGLFSIIISLLILLTKSRSLFLSIGVILFLILILNYKKIISQTLIIVVCIFLFFIKNISIFRFNKIFEVDYARLEVYKESFRLFKENILTGVGYANFFVAQDKTQYSLAPYYANSHNLVLKFLCETGILGTLAFFFLIISIIVVLTKRKKQKIDYLTLMILISLMIFENFELLVLSRTVYSLVFMYVALSLNQEYKFYKKQREILEC